MKSASGGPAAVERPWALESDKVLDVLGVSRATGLDENQVYRRRREYGHNRLREVRAKSVWNILSAQFESMVVLLLVVAAAASFAFGNIVDGSAIGAVILINAIMGFVMEWRAVRSMEALRKLGGASANVRRNSELRGIPAEELVPGDVVSVEGGDVVSADMRLLEASKLQADESTLTGESMPVGKGTATVAADAPVSERGNMLFKGTVITRGSGEGVVVATGMASELGEIAEMADQAKDEATPLEKRLDRLGRRLVWVTLGVTVLMAVAGIFAGKEPYLMMETAIALAVAAIPEGLPIVATIALARGMWRMAGRNALVKRLSAVETLGATAVICTDKTGTLTENRMSVVRYALEDGGLRVDSSPGKSGARFAGDGGEIIAEENELLRAALTIGALCNNASISDDESDEGGQVGDPLEVALLRVAALAGIQRGKLIGEMPEAREVAFDPEVKMMATFHSWNGRFKIAVKGAAESVLGVSTRVLARGGQRELSAERRRDWQDMNTRMAADGLRVLGLAVREVDDSGAEPYEDLTFIGLVGLLDPPRSDVRDALSDCRRAGIHVVMVTGDQSETAIHVAREVGLTGEEEETNVIPGNVLENPESLDATEIGRLRKASIFARVSPKQKLGLIAIHQQAGEIVAMTGDGVNDAPALKKADIGIAMGRRGTEVAREAADMILKDDAFSSITAAVRHGRVIFDNIRNFVVYLMSCNLSEILVVGVASFTQMPLPILPLQILFLNLVTDVFPALALGMSAGDPGVMDRSPRDSREALLTRGNWWLIVIYGILITFSVMTAYILALEVFRMSPRHAVTVSFLVLALAQIWHVFNLRGQGSSVLSNDVIRNPYVWGAVALCVVLVLAAVYLPGMSGVLKLSPPGADGWKLVIGFCLVPLAAGQIICGVRRSRISKAASMPVS